MTPEQNQKAVDQIRAWLNHGASISAVDPSKPVLVDPGDGLIFSGLLITFRNSEMPTFLSCISHDHAPFVEK